MTTYLDRILLAHREAASADGRSLDDVIEVARRVGPTRDVIGSLRSGDRLAVIAELKRASPSKGSLAPDADAAEVARSYAAGGAAAMSVLTDEAFFEGSADDLAAARAAVSLPVLRKDFTVSALDVCDARIMGADMVLLIVAALDDVELADFSALTGELGMTALVEAHDEAEVERAMAHASPTLIGVNQRDLVTFRVDTDRAVRVAASLPEEVTLVAESGITGPADARRLADAGFHAVLVGEHLVTSDDPAGSLDELRVPRRS